MDARLTTSMLRRQRANRGAIRRAQLTAAQLMSCLDPPPVVHLQPPLTLQQQQQGLSATISGLSASATPFVPCAARLSAIAAAQTAAAWRPAPGLWFPEFHGLHGEAADLASEPSSASCSSPSLSTQRSQSVGAVGASVSADLVVGSCQPPRQGAFTVDVSTVSSHVGAQGGLVPPDTAARSSAPAFSTRSRSGTATRPRSLSPSAPSPAFGKQAELERPLREANENLAACEAVCDELAAADHPEGVPPHSLLPRLDLDDETDVEGDPTVSRSSATPPSHAATSGGDALFDVPDLLAPPPDVAALDPFGRVLVSLGDDAPSRPVSSFGFDEYTQSIVYFVQGKRFDRVSLLRHAAFQGLALAPWASTCRHFLFPTHIDDEYECDECRADLAPLTRAIVCATCDVSLCLRCARYIRSALSRP